MHTVLVDGDRLYAMSPSPNAETLIFDIRKPTDPTLLSRYVRNGPSGAYPHDAFAYEDRLSINNLGHGYEVVDVKDPTAPRHLGEYLYPGSASHANAVDMARGLLILPEP